MELVVALMAPSASNFELGFGVLNDIHFRPGPILVTKADISALDNLRQPGGYVGLRNGGATCYMNAGTAVGVVIGSRGEGGAGGPDNLRQPGGYVVLRNGGATCYMNAGTLASCHVRRRKGG